MGVIVCLGQEIFLLCCIHARALEATNIIFYFCLQSWRLYMSQDKENTLHLPSEP